MKRKGIPYDPGRRAVTGSLIKGVVLFTAYSACAGVLTAGQLKGVFANSGNSGLEDTLNNSFGLKGISLNDGKYPPPTPQPTKEPAKPTSTPQNAPFTLEDFYKNPVRYQAVVPLSERDLATAVRIVYNEVGMGQVKKAGTKGLHDVLWVMVNRFKEKGIFPYADSITSVGLARNQFQPVWPSTSGQPSYFYADLFEKREGYEPLPKKLTDVYIEKFLNMGYGEEEAKAMVGEYSKTVLTESLKVFSGQVPERLFIEIDGVRYGALWFKNP
ncbi:MAG TPA: hypothetical protein VJB06_04620, partial [archaeon]|nr:hypothetical protein [archaeon]